MESVNKEGERSTIRLSHADLGAFPCFWICFLAEQAMIEALQSAEFNSYAHFWGMLPARRAVAQCITRDLPYGLCPDEVHITLGCTQAMKVRLTDLAIPGANILLPRPGFPNYESYCAFLNLEVRHYDLRPGKDWEVDFDAVEALADEKTAAIVIINPGNPCGNVFSYDHLKKIADTARKLGILVIGDEVYDILVLGLLLLFQYGGNCMHHSCYISKKWAVPGWRLGWLVTNILKPPLNNLGSSLSLHVDILCIYLSHFAEVMLTFH